MTRRIVLCLALAAFALGCTAKSLPTEAPIAVAPAKMSGNEWRVVDNVIVVTDASGTTYAEKTFPRSKALSRSFVSALPETSERAENPSRYSAGSIGFGGDDRVVHPLSDFDRTALSSTVGRVDVMGAIDGRGGRTPLNHVFGEIGQSLDGRSGRAAVVLFSDGRPDDTDDALDAAQALIGGYSPGVCIHAVQVGGSAEGEQFMRTLSELTSPCGSFRNADSIGASDQIAGFAHNVMAGIAPPSPTPPVAAPSCNFAGEVLDIEFANDKASLRAGSAESLDRAASRIRGCPEAQITIGGYTSSPGAEDYNQNLSERRASTVRDYLVGQGVGAGQLDAKGYGEADPIATNATAEGRAKNRRVELRSK